MHRLIKTRLQRLSKLSLSLIAYLLVLCQAQVIPGLPDLPSTLPSPSAVATVLPTAPFVPPPIPNLPSPSGTPSVYPYAIISPQVSELRCKREPSLDPRPTLGSSQLRYALCVVLSAAMIAAAAKMYWIAMRWEHGDKYGMIRFMLLFVARILIFCTVKLSAALVASISNSDPNDGALDASDAFITWGSAIVLRMYYEGLNLLIRAIGYVGEKSEWCHIVDKFLGREENLVRLPISRGTSNRSTSRPIRERRKSAAVVLLVLHTVLYLTTEISVLVINFVEFINRYAGKDEAKFYPMDKAGQCGIMDEDLVGLIGVIATQLLFLLAQQQSLVPMLTVWAYHPRWRNLVILTFIVWIVSIGCLPLFSGKLDLMFTVGDLSLFWYVLLAPSRYTDRVFIITAVYALGSACIWLILILTRSIALRQNQTTTRR